MKIAIVARFLSIVSFAVSLCLLFPIAWSYGVGDAGLVPLLLSLAAGFSICLPLTLYGRRISLEEMETREATLAVILSWMTASLIGALPYWFGGYANSFLDAYFEGISGFTTTGATVLSDLSSIPKSVLLWRNFTQWLGGMGIIALTLALMPISGAGMRLYASEIPGPIHEKLTPRIQGTAVFLWKAYIALTATQFFCLKLGGLGFFDSLTLTFSTIATGGFSPYRESVGHFDSEFVKWVTALFLFLGGANFTLYHVVIFRRTLRPLKENPEFRFYCLILLAAGLLMSLSLYTERVFDSFGEALSQGFFQAVSMISTCGFFVTDYGAWPSSARFLILLLMLCGGCAVSSAGGITCIRVLLILKHVRNEFSRLLHPRAVIPTRLGDSVVEPWVVSGCFAFFSAYLGIFVIGVIGATLFGQDMLTALSGTAATLGNVGPGFGMVGPVDCYAILPTGLKVLYILMMLFGRLEIFTLLLLFYPRFWREGISFRSEAS